MAALALIDEGGPTGIPSLRSIAARAGVTAPAIYPHFPNLDALVDEALARSFADLERRVEAAMVAAGSPGSALLAAATAYVDFGWRYPRRYELMFSADGYAPRSVAILERVAGALADCVANGSSMSTDPGGDAFQIWVAAHGMATLRKPARENLRRLGSLDRPAILATMVQRLARLHG